MSLTYKDAGVDIAAGEQLVERIKPAVAATRRPEVLSGLGGFAGLCSLPTGYREPILVSGTDGVGTKLKTAFATGRHDTVGIDLVAMCVNDILVTGAEPLLFLDYFATGKLEVDAAAEVIAGIARGCQEAGCALIGGETAELPGLYQPGDYDIAGFCVGVVEKSEIRAGAELRSGDVLLALHSSGLHSNGHSLARRVLLEELALPLDARPEILRGATVADVLLEPTIIYKKALRALDNCQWKAAAHITGGGLIDNPPRMLAEPTLDLYIRDVVPLPPVFELIASAGVELAEMRHTFNMGIGMLVALPRERVDDALTALSAIGVGATVAGELRPGSGTVRFS